MGVKVKYSKDSGKIYAGNVLQNGNWGSHYSEVTNDCIDAVANHIVNMKMTNDFAQEIEYMPKVMKHGRFPYKITFKIEPIK